MERCSLSKIAKIAGVSKPVVYTVLKKREGNGIRVGAQTKAKILEIAQRLGYVPSKSARVLFYGKSDNVGIIFHTLVPPFYELVDLLQNEARKKGLDVTLYVTNKEAEREQYYLNLLRDGRADGVIVIMGIAGSVKRCQRFTKPPYNLKILCCGEPLAGVPTVHFNETEVGRLAAEHLVESGCKKPAFFGGSKNTTRAKGFVQYFKEKKLPSPLVFVDKKWIGYFPEGKILAQELLKLKDLPDGVFASNDLLAAALLSEALRKGLRVPEDMAIMGCDNAEVSLYTTPTLTSIDTGFPLLAKKAIDKIAGMIKGEEPKPFNTKVPIFLIVRESTKREGR